MNLTTTINLRAAKDPTRRLTLQYRYMQVALTQARLTGRHSLVPVIDLHDYTCRAVIDWVKITFELGRPTQFQYVQHVLGAVTGTRPHVEANLAGPGGVATQFTVIFQDPHLETLQACRGALEARFGEVLEPFVDGVEVSVDFTPRVPSDDSRGRMVAVLARHLFPHRDPFRMKGTRPRLSWGLKAKQNSFTLERRKLNPVDADIMLNTAGDVALPVDATYYIGHRVVGAMWRVLDKVLDRQNRPAGTWIELSKEEQRARVEVRLDRLELRILGVKSLDELLQFNFARLQGTYFKFMLPTFLSLPRQKDAADRFWEKERVVRFLKTGVTGLQAMDSRRREEQMKTRRGLLSRLRSNRVKAPAADRNGRGVSSTFVAYHLLNDRVSMALGKLAERERGK